MRGDRHSISRPLRRNFSGYDVLAAREDSTLSGKRKGNLPEIYCATIGESVLRSHKGRPPAPPLNVKSSGVGEPPPLPEGT